MNSRTAQLSSDTRPVRRIGLSRRGYQSASLLSTFNGPRKEAVPPEKMPAKATNPRTRQLNARKGTSKLEEAKNIGAKVEEEDINALPKDLSGEESSSEDEKRSRSVDIKPSIFRPAKETSKPQSSNGEEDIATKPSTGANVKMRNTKNKASTIISSSGGSKRKSQKDSPPSSNPKDMFGNYVTSAKRAKNKYTSTQSKKLISSQVTELKASQDDHQSSPIQMKSYDVPSTPKKTGKTGKTEKKFSVPGADGLSSPASLPARSQLAPTSPSPPPNFRSLRTVILDSDDATADLSFGDLGEFDSPALESQPPAKNAVLVSKNHLQATQAQEFQTYSLDDSDLLSQVQDVLRKDADDELGPVWNPQPEEYHLTQVPLPSVCPMCKAPVDSQELQAKGRMNTRAQEQFCLSHQRKTAEEDWKRRGYPIIDWQAFPLRLSKYRGNIEKLIRGEDSYYRQQYSSRIAAGKDRTLRKTTTNLIPGYYGSRGLQAISEYIMQNNTKLLKKVAPKDRLISKRSVTAYVQAVLVPDVTTLLIMEDMSVDEEMARTILEESAVMGELLQEEIKDVHVSRVEDSEEEDSDEDELA